MAIFKTFALLLATTLLGIASVSASAIGAVISPTSMAPVPQPLVLINGPSGNLTENATHIICQPNMFTFAVNSHLIDGISYLKSRDGYTEFGWQQGGGLCTRVSCEENSAIYVCNDNQHDVWVYYDVMAAYAQYIVDYTPSDPNATVCSWMQKNVDGSVFNKQVTAGQLFDNRGWNVVVGMADWTNC